MPRALDPLHELRSRLQAIATADGFNTDAGTSVFLGRTFVTGEDAPAITVTLSEEEDASVQIDASLVRKAVPYTIEGVIEADRDNPFDQGYLLLADMDRAIWQAPTLEQERLNGTAVLVEYQGFRVQQAEDGSAFCFARISLSITHAETLGHPEDAP